MKNTQPPITLEKVKKLRVAFGNFFDIDSKLIQGTDPTNFYKNVDEVGIKETSPREIERTLERWYEWYSNTTPAPEYVVNNTTLTPEQLSNLGELRDKNREVSTKIRARESEAVQKYKEDLQRQIDSNKAAQTELNGKKVWARVEKINDKETILTKEDQEKLNKYREIATNKPSSTIDELSKEIETKSGEELKKRGLSESEIKKTSRETADAIVQNLASQGSQTYIPSVTQAAIFKKISSDKKVVPLAVVSITAQAALQNSAKNNFVINQFSTEVPRTVASIAFGTDFSNEIFGPAVDNLDVTLLQTSEQGSYLIDLGQINAIQLTKLEHQIEILNRDNANELFSQSPNSFVYKQITLTDPASSKILNTPKASQLLFVTFGPEVTTLPLSQNQFNIPTPAAISKNDTVEKNKSTKKLEISKKTISKDKGSNYLKENFSDLPRRGYRELINRIQNSIDLPAIKSLFSKQGVAIGGVLALVALVVGGPAAGGTVFLGSLAITGNLGSFATGALSAIGSIFVSIGTAIIGPIIGLIIAVPLLIAFIMLVINNSAYVVPPAPPVAESGFDIGQSGFECTTEKTPTTITSSPTGGSVVAERAWGIMEDMYQGFWCYWNRSPGDFPTDTIGHPDSYPELFDEKLFAVTSNPTREQVQSSGNVLFWCTWLIQKSYAAGGVSIQNTLWSPTMFDDFKNRNKMYEGKEMTFDNIKSGAVIFFDIKNSLNRVDHVGIAHTITPAGIKFLQSNAGTKDDFLPFINGVLQNPSYATIKGVGNP